MARDLVRVVQQARREAGLDVSDRIALTVRAPGEVEKAVSGHREFVARETLADAVEFADTTGFEGTVGEGTSVVVAVRKS